MPAGVMLVAEAAVCSDATKHSEQRAGRLRVAPVLLLALLLRGVAAALMFRTDPKVWFYDQASEMTCLAHSILAGQGLSSPFCGATGPSAFLAPGYPLLVALVYRFFGSSSFASAAVLTGLNIGFSVSTVLMVMLVARRLFGNRTAYVAGVLCAVSPTMMLLPTLFWETSLSTLLLTATLALALGCVDEPKPSRWIAIGAYCGFAMFVNPALMVTFAGVVAWAAYKTRSVSLRGPLLAAVTGAAIFSVWPIRNAIELHAFVPLRSNLGYELWQGNRQESEGLFVPDVYLNQNRREYERYAAIGELAYMREKSTIAAKAIESDPMRFARLSMKRAGIFWTALGGRNISRMVIGEISATSLLAIVGLGGLWRRRMFGTGLLLIPLLVFPLPYYITHPDFRFRLLLEPVALILVAWVMMRVFNPLVCGRRDPDLRLRLVSCGLKALCLRRHANLIKQTREVKKQIFFGNDKIQ